MKLYFLFVNFGATGINLQPANSPLLLRRHLEAIDERRIRY